jgi:hypothetical protein
MSVATEPPRTGGEHAIREWLDALASGHCAPEAFLREMREQFDGDRDQSWEVLSLLDQYYRRGKIRAEVFQAVKSRLEGSALGATEDAAPTLRAAPSKTVTAPTGAPHDTVSGKFKAAPLRAAREVTIGDVLRNRYRVQAVLGHGGMGTVFEAIDEYRLDLPTSGQRIAIKVLHTAVTQRDELLAELQREFQHLQLLSHPNIVRVHEFDRDGDVAFFTMELLRGALLGRVFSARNAIALPRPYALAIIRDVGAALSHAHSQGVVHGDINPQNIFITNDGEVRVLDFGASHKLLQNTESADGEWTERAPLATPGYASCQVLEGQHPNARDDLFAFACVAYLVGPRDSQAISGVRCAKAFIGNVNGVPGMSKNGLIASICALPHVASRHCRRWSEYRLRENGGGCSRLLPSSESRCWRPAAIGPRRTTIR